MPLPVVGTLTLGGVQFPVDPGLYEPLNWSKRMATHQVDQGKLVIQDGGLGSSDNIVHLASGPKPNVIDTETVYELHRRYRRPGAVYELTDWIGNRFDVFIADFLPKVYGAHSLWTYDMKLLVLRVGKLLPVGEFTLTVIHGRGSGEYEASTTVAIVADPPPLGQQFLAWSGARVLNPTAPATTLTMPAANTTVEALYNATGKFTLVVNGGSGDGAYKAGVSIVIQADAPPLGQSFDRWTGDTDTIAEVRNPLTTMLMPVKDATITATYTGAEAGTFRLTVNGGSGDGQYAPGTRVSITADEAPEGYGFATWFGSSAIVGIDDAFAYIIMPASDVTLTAHYVPLEELLSHFEIRIGSEAGHGGSVDNPWPASLGPMPLSIGAKIGDGNPASFFTGQVDLTVISNNFVITALYDMNRVPLTVPRTSNFIGGGWQGFVMVDTGGDARQITFGCKGVDVAKNGTSVPIYWQG